MQQGKFREAVPSLERLKTKPRDASVRVILIEAYLKLGLRTRVERRLTIS